jgi:Arabinose-binding domain of AraC transcription regulator, N-term
VATISADVTDETAAHGILAEVRPDILALQGATTSGLISEDDRVLWTSKIEDPRLFPRQQDAEYTLAGLCQLVRSCFSTNWRLLKMHFEHASPSDLASLNRIFRIPIRFSQSGNRIVMERSDVDRACYPRQACHHLARFTPRLSHTPLIIRCACMALKSWAARTVADWRVGAVQELVGKAEC